jgi:hypothetical protein
LSAFNGVLCSKISSLQISPNSSLTFRHGLNTPLRVFVNLTGDSLLGATSPEQFTTSLATILAENKELKLMAETAPNLLEGRLAAVEASIKTIPTEARITELVTAGVTSGVAASMTLGCFRRAKSSSALKPLASRWKPWPQRHDSG